MSLPGQFIIICLRRPVVSQLVNFLEESRVDKTFPPPFPLSVVIWILYAHEMFLETFQKIISPYWGVTEFQRGKLLLAVTCHPS